MKCSLCHKRRWKKELHGSVTGPICTTCQNSIKRAPVRGRNWSPGIEKLEAALRRGENPYDLKTTVIYE